MREEPSSNPIFAPTRLFHSLRGYYFTVVLIVVRPDVVYGTVFLAVYLALPGLPRFEERAMDRLLLPAAVGLFAYLTVTTLFQLRVLRYTRQTLQALWMGEKREVKRVEQSLYELLAFPYRMLQIRLVSGLTVVVLPAVITMIILGEANPAGWYVQTGLLVASMFAVWFDYFCTETAILPPVRYLQTQGVRGLHATFPRTLSLGGKLLALAGLYVLGVLAGTLAILHIRHSEVVQDLLAIASPITRNAMMETVQRAQRETLQSVFVFLGLTTVGVLIPMVWLTRSLHDRLKQVFERVRHLQEGHFGMNDHDLVPDELGRLMQYLNATVNKINERISYLKKTGTDLFSTTTLIADVATQQNSSLMRQSSSVAHTSSTVEEISQSSGQIADHASSVVSQAEDTEKHAERGLRMMEDTVSRIGLVRDRNQVGLSEILKLSENIQEIEQILKLINSIADETNLIAFNAAIEASSAGESGQRFKVVANEVRSLSNRVSQSIGTVQGVIKQIQDATAQLVAVAHENSETIEASVEASGRTFDFLKEILEWARKSSEAAKQIYVAIQQQRVANRQISLSFGEISNEIHELASTAERYTQQVQNLKRFAGNIDAVTQFFNPSQSQ